MAFKHGRNAAALFAGVDITTYMTNGELEVTVDEAETSTWSNSWKTFIPGQAQLQYSFEGIWDTVANGTFTGMIGDNPAGVLTMGPSGLALGAPVRMAEIIQTKYTETAPVGGVVGFAFDCLADTVPGFGTIIAASAAVTTDGNVASVDGGAATTTGAVAHLHVTSVSASDSIVVTIEDSANNSDWSTIGTFASKAAAGAERIVIAGTIRRYVRAVDNVTGAAVSIVRTVALART